MSTLSRVALWNLAIVHTGSDNYIQSETEKSKERKLCTAMWDAALEAGLEAVDWGFARARIVLAELSEDAPDVWEKRYSYPSGCIAPRYIATADPDAQEPFEIVLSTDKKTRNILCNESPATLVYTALIKDPTLFTPLFVTSLSWKLAELIGPGLGVNTKKLVGIQNSFALAVTHAANADANARKNRETPDAPHIAARA